MDNTAEQSVDETNVPQQDAILPAVVTGRSEFINRTYMHLAGAILGFIGIEVALFTSGLAMPIATAMLNVSWLAVLGAFMVVAWGGSHVAHRAVSKKAQYMALAAFVFAEAIIFVPLLVIAFAVSPALVQNAALFTLAGFGALTGVAFYTGKDFSFLRSLLIWGGVSALGLIVLGVIMGFHLGTYFSVAMIALAGASILYDTSKVIHDYPDDRYVAAALELFSSVALLFWYVLRLLMSRR